jgi:hypothetical protein
MGAGKKAAASMHEFLMTGKVTKPVKDENEGEKEKKE